MSAPKLISPMLDNFSMGDPITDRKGVRCCPAMDNATEDKYIVKIISSPASQTQLDALLLSGAYSSKEAALAYYKTITDGIEEEISVLQKLSKLEGFLPFDDYQIVPMEEQSGYDVYLLSRYRNTLEQALRHSSMTQLDAVNLALDLCSALSVCRRSGYLYIDLKPENIYLANEKSYRIGDIGFVKLSSLKYASLPERYHSAYTAPEISDAFSSLNTTIDIYALGLILYQVFNAGTLPFHTESAPGEDFAPPAFADYEMAEIILKACAANPEDRYQDPVEMGQALVSYMQRNGANDTPIIPIVPQEETAEPSKDVDMPQDTPVEIEPEDITEEHIYTEDEDGNLTFLEEEITDETAPDLQDSQIDYEEVSEEVSDILTQADDLLAHPTPDPVVQPEMIDVPMPPPLPVEEENSQEERSEEDVPSDDLDTDIGVDDQADLNKEEECEENDLEAVPKKTHWLRNLFLTFLAIAILVASFFFYTKYYLQPIESIVLEEGDNCSITVNISSKLEESKLTVICYDTYGNQLLQPVRNSKAVFENLAPNAAYTVKVVTEGFHKLTGDTSAAFTTPVQTNIVQLSAVTGSEDGSAVIGFIIDGPDAKQWCIRYSAANEEEKIVSFAGHMITITGLTPGKEYAIELSPEEDLLTTGNTKITHIASSIVKPVDLRITGLVEKTLSVAWSSPEDTTVESWTVRCYNDENFDETKVVSECAASFDNVDPSMDYTIEVIAAGMSVGERVFVPKNAKTVTNFKADLTDANKITLSWNTDDSIYQEGWKVVYSIDGSPSKEIPCSDDNTANIDYKVPGSSYAISLETPDGSPVLGSALRIDIPAAKNFSGYAVKASNMTFKMCKRPSQKNWDRHDLSSKDYTTTFAPNTKASFLVKLDKKYNTSPNKITSLFVIRDENGRIVSTETSVKSWTKMWYNRYCELDIPSIPQIAGKYTISIYFNGGLVHQQDFTVK